MRALLLLLMLVALAAGCGSDDDSDAGGNDDTTTAVTGECDSAEIPPARESGSLEPPTEPLASGTSYALVVDTNCGSFTISLDLESAPNTSASLVALAQDAFFDDTIFHRIVPGFVIQGGDPTQLGSGGPGYSTVDAPAQDARYTKGVVAMAKTPAEPAGTSGSQFFVVTGDDVGLPPDYAIVGEVTEGIEVVDQIGALGDPATEQPTQPVVIDTITVEES
jgi:peptidyl-prolyl cis-trans isomerase B (cyclophilin B)